jgi:hypothetical protein
MFRSCRARSVWMGGIERHPAGQPFAVAARLESFIASLPGN